MFVVELTALYPLTMLGSLGLPPVLHAIARFSLMVEDGQDAWVELYRSALMELDRTKLPQKIEAANTAIHQRINALLMSKDGHPEYSALEDALRNLRSLRRQIE